MSGDEIVDATWNLVLGLQAMHDPGFRSRTQTYTHECEKPSAVRVLDAELVDR